MCSVSGKYCFYHGTACVVARWMSRYLNVAKKISDKFFIMFADLSFLSITG